MIQEKTHTVQIVHMQQQWVVVVRVVGCVSLIFYKVLPHQIVDHR